MPPVYNGSFLFMSSQPVFFFQWKMEAVFCYHNWTRMSPSNWVDYCWLEEFQQVLPHGIKGLYIISSCLLAGIMILQDRHAKVTCIKRGLIAPESWEVRRWTVVIKHCPESKALLNVICFVTSFTSRMQSPWGGGSLLCKLYDYFPVIFYLKYEVASHAQTQCMSIYEVTDSSTR